MAKTKGEETKEDGADENSNKNLNSADGKKDVYIENTADLSTEKEPNLEDKRKRGYENDYSEDEVVEEERINTTEPDEQVDLGNERLQETRSRTRNRE